MVKKTQSSSMELLAPVGTSEAFFAALEAGADAVYIGAPGLNARALSHDFSLEEIGQMVKHAHDRQKKVYIAMNSLAKEDELSAGIEILSAFAEGIRPDALIIQDVGLWFLAKKYFPTLSLHASTLMSVHNSLGAQTMSDLGMERVVLARELSLQDIQQISKKSNVELEVFIHGAMCYSYSGLCLFSSLHGGKSSLRGQCVQPCRRRYTTQPGRKQKGGKNQGKSGFYFSMNDLCTISSLRALQQTNVVSLKIEGRLRPAEYVRNTVTAYRLCLDNLNAHPQEQEKIEQEASRLLSLAMGRYRSEGYLGGVPHQLITPHKTGGAGIFLGNGKYVQRKGSSYGRSFFTLLLKQDLQVGDRLRFHDEMQDVRFSFTLKKLFLGQRSVNSARKGQQITLQVEEKSKGKGVLPRQGGFFKVDVKGRGKSTQHQERKLQKEQVKVSIDRSRVETVLTQGLGHGEEKGSFTGNGGQGRRLQWWYRLGSLPPVKQRFPTTIHRLLLPVTNKNVEQILALGKRAVSLYPNLVWTLPPIIQENEVADYTRWLIRLQQLGFSRYQLGSLGQKKLFDGAGKHTPPSSLFADYTWNVLNSAALQHGLELGLEGMLFSIEAEKKNVQQSVTAWRKSGMPDGLDGHKHRMLVGAYVYGYPPLFTAQLPVAEERSRQHLMSPKGEQLLVERKNELTLVRAKTPFSLLHAIGELAADGIDYVLIDLEGSHLQKEYATISRLLKGKPAAGLATMQGNYEGRLL